MEKVTLVVALIALLGANTSWAQTSAPTTQPATASTASDKEELKRRVEILTEEVQGLKEKLVLPEKEELKSSWGLGPAASRVYRTQRGLAVGGYGEFYYEARKDQPNAGDMLRYVQYVGYKFTDKLLVNVELEFEHGTTSTNYAGSGGSVSVEFASLEYLAHPMLNIRAGVLLLPVGFINEMHEPPFFHGNLRPLVEDAIIPTTWRELGVGLFGRLADGLTYKLYGVTGFNGAKFGEGGWRGGRQKGGRPLAEDLAGAFALSYDFRSMLQLGASVYFGGADHGQLEGGEDVFTLLVEAHAQLRWRGLELRALGAFTSTSNADLLSQHVYPDSGDPTDPETRLVGSQGYGWYVEAAYDVWSLFSARPLYLAPYARFELLDTQADTEPVAGRAKNADSKRRVIEGGLSFKPHSQVVIKLNYRNTDGDGDGDAAQSFFVGAGFIY